MRKRSYWVNPYVFSMITILEIGIFALCLFILNMVAKDQPESLPKLLKFIVLPFVCVHIPLILWEARQFWGRLVITEDALEIHAFPRKKLRLEFDEIEFMGIDYDHIDTGAQFWMYFTNKEGVQEIIKYKHRLIKVRYKNGIIKCVYRRAVYDAIREAFPGRLRKDLERCCEDAIREYKLNKEK